MDKEEHWYALYVRMHHEKKTAARLDELGVTNYLPVQETVRQWSDRKKKLTVVVIPMMIFVRTDEQGRLELIRDFPSITGALIDRSTHRPAVIRDEEMERFRFMLDFSEQTVHFIDKPLAPGDKVKVIKGPLAGLEGELIYLDNKSEIVVRIDQLGSASVEIPGGYVEKLYK